MNFIKIANLYKTILLVFFFGFSFIIVGSENKLYAQDVSMEGKNAPDFSLKDLKGKNIKLSGYKGKVVILDFWATWCPPCRAEIPSFIALQKEYKKKGLVVLGIALDDQDKVAKFVKDNQINYPVVIGDNEISKLYGGVSGIPTTFVINKAGKIIKQYVGMKGKDVFEKDILTLF